MGKTIIRSSKKGEEKEWRNTKKLGLGDYEDMTRKIELSNTAMKSIEKIWSMRKINITNEKVEDIQNDSEK